MEPSLSIAARTALASGLVTVSMAAVTVAFHGAMRWRAQRLEHQIQELAGCFARYLTGDVATEPLRAASSAAPTEAFWGAIQRFADNIGGDEWLWLSRQLTGLHHLRHEREQLETSKPWRREMAARRLGMVDEPAARVALRAALDQPWAEVRLRALLSLARQSDPTGLDWLLQHPAMVEGVAPSIVLATLKRFGPEFAPRLRALVADPAAHGALVVAAVEVLGFWGFDEARASIEQRLGGGGLEERVAAARALGNLGSRRAAPGLIAALDDPAWQVRAQASRALGRLQEGSAVPRLERATTDMAWWVRRNASYALAELGAPGTAALHRIAGAGTDRYAREMAIETLQALEWEQQSPGGLGRVG